METEEALRIVRTLADGVDPQTGLALPANSTIQNAKTVRALYTVIELAERTQKAKLCPLPAEAGKPWSKIEDERLCSEFHDAIDFHEIAKIHGRTRGAIFSRLTKLGQIKPKMPTYKAG